MNIEIKGGLWLLGIAFVVLKLTHVIDWSWWWICSPFYVPVGLIILGVVLWIIGCVLETIFGK